MSRPYDRDGREKLVIKLIAEGYTDQRIAHRLGVTDTTVRGLVARIRARYGAASRAHLVALAFRAGDLE